MDLEPQIRDHAQMAELARYRTWQILCVQRARYAFTEDEKRADAETVCFAISHIADMANELEKAWDRAFLATKEAA